MESQVGTKKLFLDQVCERSDKWSVLFIDGSERNYKHIYGGSDELADMVDWSQVQIIDGELQVGAI